MCVILMEITLCALKYHHLRSNNSSPELQDSWMIGFHTVLNFKISFQDLEKVYIEIGKNMHKY